MQVSQAARVREYARKEYIEPARDRGETTVRIIAGEVHRGLGLSNKVPNVCQAIGSRIFQRESGVVLETRKGPPSGSSTSVEFVFRLMAPVETVRPETSDEQFGGLRGIARDVFRNLGGGEAFLRGEREEFSRDRAGSDEKRTGQ